MSIEQLETRLGWIERLVQTASVKDLPSLNATYQKLLDRIVALDMTDATDEGNLTPSPDPQRAGGE